MRVMFDPQIFCHQKFGGISRYFCSMVLEMEKVGDVVPLIAAPFHFNDYLEQLPSSVVEGKRVRWMEGKTALSYGLSYLPGHLAARRFRPDIFHNTYYFPVSAPFGARRIVTIYDMINEKFPDYFAASRLISRWKSASIAGADHVICISESTKRDVLAAYDIAEDRVSVTHLGYDALNLLLTGESANAFKTRVLGQGAPYMLYVGSRLGYKNFKGLLAAYASSASLRRDFLLVCLGGGGFTDAERAAILEAGVTNRVKQLSGSDAVLAACYAHAELFVCPSYYEGFGIPVLEAMSLDCPVACSNTSSLPEVVGDAAELFDPLQSESIRTALESVLYSASRTAELRERGRVRRQLFSWRTCAQNTLDIYRRVLDS